METFLIGFSTGIILVSVVIDLMMLTNIPLWAIVLPALTPTFCALFVQISKRRENHD